jgi:hypothetical protein
MHSIEILMPSSRSPEQDRLHECPLLPKGHLTFLLGYQLLFVLLRHPEFDIRMNCFFSPASFHFSPLIFRFLLHPPLLSPHTPILLPLHYVRSWPTISCELGGCSHLHPPSK